MFDINIADDIIKCSTLNRKLPTEFSLIYMISYIVNKWVNKCCAYTTVNITLGLIFE